MKIKNESLVYRFSYEEECSLDSGEDVIVEYLVEYLMDGDIDTVDISARIAETGEKLETKIPFHVLMDICNKIQSKKQIQIAEKAKPPHPVRVTDPRPVPNLFPPKDGSTEIIKNSEKKIQLPRNKNKKQEEDPMLGMDREAVDSI